MFWCWLQEWLCTSADVVRPPLSSDPLSPVNNDDNEDDDDDDDDDIDHLLAVCRTVIALDVYASADLTTNTKTPKRHAAATASDDNLAAASVSTTITNNAYLASSCTNNNFNNNNNNNNDSINRPPIVGSVRKAATPISLDLSNNKMKKRKISAPTTTKRSFGGGGNLLPDQLNEILEECEYDSDIGKFICDPIDGGSTDEPPSSATSATTQLTTGSTESPPPSTEIGHDGDGTVKIKRAAALPGGGSSVLKRIEFFENNCEELKIEPKLGGTRDKDSSTKMSSVLCLATFGLTILLLYLFPIPD